MTLGGVGGRSARAGVFAVVGEEVTWMSSHVNNGSDARAANTPGNAQRLSSTMTLSVAERPKTSGA